MEDPREVREQCRRCPRRTGTFVPPTARQSGLAVLASKPGEVDAREGEHLHPDGRDGKLLVGLLNKSGWTESGFSKASSVLCHTSSDPTPYEQACCADLVEEWLAEAKPRVLLALGNEALVRTLGKTGLRSWRGSRLPRPETVELGTTKVPGPEVYKSGSKKGQSKLVSTPVVYRQAPGLVVVPTLSGGQLVESGFEEWALVQADVRRAVREAKGEPLVEITKQLLTNSTPETLASFFSQHRSFVLDLETDGGADGKISLVGLCADDSYALSANWTRAVRAVVGDALARTDGLLIGHNLVFDVGKLEEDGLVVGSGLWDTMVAAHFDRPDLPKGLDMACSRLEGLDYWNWKQGHRDGTQPDTALYNALDVAFTKRLYDETKRTLERTHRLEHFEGVLMPALRALITMMREGVALDTDGLARLREMHGAAMSRTLDEWNVLTDNLNPGSHKQLLDYFTRVHRLKIPISRKTGNPTLDRKALSTLLSRHEDIPALALLGRLRHLQTIWTTFLDPLATSDGRIHPRYNLAGTSFGRLSGGGDDGFNIQNIPRNGSCPMGVEGCACCHIRKVFVPDAGDSHLVVGDWSQIEFRLSALLAGESGLLQDFTRPDFDIHQRVADQLGIPRNLAKRIVHGSNYGMGPGKLAVEVGITKLQAQGFLDRFKALWPSLARWRETVVERARRQGWLANPFGRRAYFPVTRDGLVNPPEAIAFTPQSTAADMMLVALGVADRQGLKIRWSVHDELGLSGDASLVEVLRSVMEAPYPRLGGWSCPSDIHAAASWAEAK